MYVIIQLHVVINDKLITMLLSNAYNKTGLELIVTCSGPYQLIVHIYMYQCNYICVILELYMYM